MSKTAPCTDKEIHLSEGQIIVTKTDLKGHILYANEDFCRISGFSINELVGKPHNLVRHPDMPREAFRDLWQTLQSGKTWNGLVKNRCKNGDYYWVNAYVAPIKDNDVIIGFVSSRIKAEPEQIREAATLYAGLNSGKCFWALREGKKIPVNPLFRYNPIRLLLQAKVATQLAVMVSAFVLGMLLSTFLGFRLLEQVKVNGPIYERVAQGKDLIADILPPPAYLIESWLTTLEMMAATPEELPKLIRYGRQLREDYQTRYQYWKDHLQPGRMRELMVDESYKQASIFLDTRDQQLIPALQAGDKQRAEALLPVLKSSYQLHRAAIDQVVKEANSRNQADELYARDFIYQNYIGSGVMILLVIVCIGVPGMVIVRRIGKQLGGEPGFAAEITRHIAVGNLAPFTLEAHVEKNSLLGSITLMQGKLQQLLAGIYRDAEAVSHGAGRLASASNKVKSTASDSSLSAGKIAASTVEMKANIADVAGNVDQAMAVSLDSGQICRQGAEVISQAVSSMQSIAQTVHGASDTVKQLDEQSAKIASVVQVIYSIADQTNLLALNAAIEAARAGEYGRGFAVVADEVRNLAKRTAVATQEITQVINDIQNGMKNAAGAMESGVGQVNRGVSLAGEAGKAIEQIQNSVSHVASLISDISKSMHEQSLASLAVAENIDIISKTADQNSLEANDSAKAAVELEQAAQNLAMSISRFAV